MKKSILSLALLTALVGPSFAENAKTITLQDGSRVKGNIVSMDNGFYTVETPSMGEVRIADSDIASIAAGEGPDQPQMPSNIAATPEFQSVQAKVVGNPEIMGEIQNLMQDPEVMSVISDPGFIAAVQSGNTTELQSDPRLQRLIENPKIQLLIEKIRSQQ
jgi:hypothetical protein